MAIEVEKTPLAGLLLFKPKVFSDPRGFFYESWRLEDYRTAGVKDNFLQDNCSRSAKNVLRGLHVQKAQGKMMWVTQGAVLAVALDIRPGSPTYSRHFSVELNHADPAQLYMEPGFASGFYVKSEFACINYKCSQYYDPAGEFGILWSDPALQIDWGAKDPVMSTRDKAFPRLRDFKERIL